MPTSEIEDTLSPGSMLGTYKVTGLIKSGGTGNVYTASHQGTDRNVVIKVLLHKFAADSIAVQAFIHAAKALARVNHANVVTIFDFAMCGDGRPYIVMEKIIGKNMETILHEERTLSHLRVRRLFGQICLGMQAVHKTGIVHRDLKPANFFISSKTATTNQKENSFGKKGSTSELDEGGDEMVTVIDFSFCKTIDLEPNRLTIAGDIVGTPYYMSPEQCMGMVLDQRSDIYSVGCSMFEALSGTKPFIGATMIETMRKHLSERPTFSSDQPEENKGLQAVIMRCLESRQEDRYQTMEALHQDLVGLEVKTKPSKNLRNQLENL